MAAIHDAVVALTDHGSNTDARHLIDELTARGQLSLESVTFLRGRSLQRQMVVIDEAQNLEPTTLRTILTRVGEGTKVVFTGDTSQIDAPVPRRVEQRPRRAHPGLQRAVLLRPHHDDRLRAQRRRQPRRRAALVASFAPRTPLARRCPAEAGASRPSAERLDLTSPRSLRTGPKRSAAHRWRSECSLRPGDLGARPHTPGLGSGAWECRGSPSSTWRRPGCPAAATGSSRSASSRSRPTARSSTSGRRLVRLRWPWSRVGPRRVHGITRRTLRGAPRAAVALAELRRRLDGARVHRPQRRLRRRLHRAGGRPLEPGPAARPPPVHAAAVPAARSRAPADPRPGRRLPPATTSRSSATTTPCATPGPRRPCCPTCWPPTASSTPPTSSACTCPARTGRGPSRCRDGSRPVTNPARPAAWSADREHASVPGASPALSTVSVPPLPTIVSVSAGSAVEHGDQRASSPSTCTSPGRRTRRWRRRRACRRRSSRRRRRRPPAAPIVAPRSIADAGHAGAGEVVDGHLIGAAERVEDDLLDAGRCPSRCCRRCG